MDLLRPVQHLKCVLGCPFRLHRIDTAAAQQSRVFVTGLCGNDIFNLCAFGCQAERGCCADWFGKGTHNTTSFTPIRGAYMHYYIVLIHPDSQTLQATATDLEYILEHYTTHFYAYDNLSSDPKPGMCLAPYAVRLTLASCHAEIETASNFRLFFARSLASFLS